MDASQRDVFERIAENIKPDSLRAMLVLQESPGKSNWRMARDLIEGMTAEPVDVEIVEENHPAVVIFRLNPEDLREAVLTLTAKGFNRLKAIDAKIKS